MKTIFNYLARDEDGAVTVDWVVLTASVVGLAVGVIAILGDEPVNIGNAISSTLANDIVIVTE